MAWCGKRGTRLADPSERIAGEYFKAAEETLRLALVTEKEGSNMWLAAQKYYAEYLAAYSLLARIGVKTEIHSCTIGIIRLLEEDGLVGFPFSSLLEKDRDLRIDNQYYLRNSPVDFDPKRISELLLEVRKLLKKLTHEDLKRLRRRLSAELAG